MPAPFAYTKNFLRGPLGTELSMADGPHASPALQLMLVLAEEELGQEYKGQQRRVVVDVLLSSSLPQSSLCSQCFPASLSF